MTLYMVVHTEGEYDDRTVKVLGLYSTMEKAQARIDALTSAPPLPPEQELVDRWVAYCKEKIQDRRNERSHHAAEINRIEEHRARLRARADDLVGAEASQRYKLLQEAAEYGRSALVRHRTDMENCDKWQPMTLPRYIDSLWEFKPKVADKDSLSIQEIEPDSDISFFL